MIRKLFIISIIWAFLILVLCAIPGNDLPKSPVFRIPNFDKIIHAVLYFPLAILIIPVFDLSRRFFIHLSAPVLTILIIAIYGGFIEIAQDLVFRNRSADIADLLFDLIGGLSGILVYYLFIRSLFKKWRTRTT